jgi:hypothetical protein
LLHKPQGRLAPAPALRTQHCHRYALLPGKNDAELVKIFNHLHTNKHDQQRVALWALYISLLQCRLKVRLTAYIDVTVVRSCLAPTQPLLPWFVASAAASLQAAQIKQEIVLLGRSCSKP